MKVKDYYELPETYNNWSFEAASYEYNMNMWKKKWHDATWLIFRACCEEDEQKALEEAKQAHHLYVTYYNLFMEEVSK